MTKKIFNEKKVEKDWVEYQNELQNFAVFYLQF